MAILSSSTRGVTLITGASGFTAFHLRNELVRRGHTVIGVDHRINEHYPEDIVCDLLDKEAVEAVMRATEPQRVVHLAGLASAIHENVDDLYTVNILGARHLLEATEELMPNVQCVILASSATVYGRAVASPIAEESPLAPTNDYAASKAGMESMASVWRNRLPVTIVRPFNYTGLGQSTKFVIPKIVDHFRRRASFIELGNTHPVREFLDVRTVVAAYRMLLEQPHSGEVFNICAGRGTSLRGVITMAEQLTGHRIEVRTSAELVRENEPETLVGSAKRLESAVGSLPEYSMRDTLSWMLNA